MFRGEPLQFPTDDRLRRGRRLGPRRGVHQVRLHKPWVFSWTTGVRITWLTATYTSSSFCCPNRVSTHAAAPFTPCPQDRAQDPCQGVFSFSRRPCISIRNASRALTFVHQLTPHTKALLETITVVHLPPNSQSLITVNGTDAHFLKPRINGVSHLTLRPSNGPVPFKSHYQNFNAPLFSRTRLRSIPLKIFHKNISCRTLI